MSRKGTEKNENKRRNKYSMPHHTTPHRIIQSMKYKSKSYSNIHVNFTSCVVCQSNLLFIDLFFFILFCFASDSLTLGRFFQLWTHSIKSVLYWQHWKKERFSWIFSTMMLFVEYVSYIYVCVCVCISQKWKIALAACEWNQNHRAYILDWNGVCQ